MIRPALLAWTMFAVATACEPAERTGESAEAPAAEAAAQVEIGGPYSVTGVTVDDASGAQRPIAGTVVLKVDGDKYTAHFELSTVFPGTVSVAADVVGEGDGTIHGETLEGTSRTQLVIAGVPGVDVDFAFIPRQVGPRIVSKAVGRIFPDGTVRIDIHNQPQEGEEYSPTTTTLVGFPQPGEY